MIEVVFGKIEKGKTTLVNELISQDERLVVWDFLNEYDLNQVDSLKQLELILDNLYRFRVNYPGSADKFNPFCGLIYQYENMKIVVEEVDAVCNTAKIEKWFNYCIQYGRHRFQNYILVARRPHLVNRLVTSQAKIFYVFNTTEPRDLLYYRETFGADVSEQIRNLDKFDYLKIEV